MKTESIFASTLSSDCGIIANPLGPDIECLPNIDATIRYVTRACVVVFGLDEFNGGGRYPRKLHHQTFQ